MRRLSAEEIEHKRRGLRPVDKGDLVVGLVNGINIPIYAEHPLEFLIRKLKGSTPSKPWPTKKMLSDKKSSPMPDELSRLKSGDVAVVVAKDGQFVMVTTGSVVGWLVANLVRQC